jgi:hypothetical protein
MSTVTVRFVFLAVSAEARRSGSSHGADLMKDFLWSKFWTGLVPVLVLTGS